MNDAVFDAASGGMAASPAADAELFREAVENATDAIGMSTPQGRHYFQNAAFTRLFGDVGESPPETLYVDPAVGREVFQTIMAGGRWVGEVRMNGRDGRTLDVWLRAYANKRRDNGITSLVGIHTDMTVLKKAQADLLQSLQHLKATVDAIPDLLFETDVEGRIHAFHAPDDQAFFVPPEQFEGRRMKDVLPPPAAAVIGAALAEAARCGRHRGAVYSLPMRGGLRWFEASIAAVPATAAEPRRFIFLVHEMTARIQAQQELGRLNEELERRVTERTALAEERAGQLRDLAEQLARTEQVERRRIARIIHDDLQQNLVSARYHLHSLRAAQPETVGQVDDLIRKMLDTASSLTAELSPAILYEAGLDAALPWLARQMKARYGLDVHVSVEAAVPSDPGGVVELLFLAARELLFNVVKHAAVQEASVELKRGPAGTIHLVVHDRGAGFDPSGTLRADGGFGLFELKERIQRVGGAMTISSAPGSGTCVRLAVREPAGRRRGNGSAARRT